MRRAAAAVAGGVVAAVAVAAPASARTVTVTQAKNGNSVTLAKDDKLVVMLAENPSTGYGWKTVARPTCLTRLSSRYVPDPVPSGPPIVGSGGRRTFTYAARARGQGTLRLVYRRSSDTDGATRFTLKVIVK